MQSVTAREQVVEQLADRYYERVLCFVRRIAAADAADDIVQEVFLRLSKLEGLEHRDISISYLLKIAHNLVRARDRREARRAAKRGLIEQIIPPRAHAKLVGSPGIDRSETLAAALGELTENEQEAVRLTVCCGLSLREASEALGVRVTTVTNWKYRGLQKLARISGPVVAA